jgi:hypothetical protein
MAAASTTLTSSRFRVLERESEALGRDDTVAVLLVTGSVRALGRSGFVVSPSFGWLDGSSDRGAAAFVSLLAVADVVFPVVVGASFASPEAGAGCVSVGLVSVKGSSFVAPGLTTRGAGIPINVAFDDETDRVTGAGELGETGGLLPLSARAGELAGGRLALAGRGGVDAGRGGKVLGWSPSGVLVGLAGIATLGLASGLVESLTLAAGGAAGALGCSSGEPQRSSRSSDSSLMRTRTLSEMRRAQRPPEFFRRMDLSVAYAGSDASRQRGQARAQRATLLHRQGTRSARSGTRSPGRPADLPRRRRPS